MPRRRRSVQDDSEEFFSGWRFFQPPYLEILTNLVYSKEVTQKSDLENIFTADALTTARTNFELVVKDKNNVFDVTERGKQFSILTRQSPLATRAYFLKLMCERWSETKTVIKELQVLDYLEPSKIAKRLTEKITSGTTQAQVKKLKTILDDVFDRYLRLMRHKGKERQFDLNTYQEYRILYPTSIPALEREWPIPSLDRFRDVLQDVFKEAKQSHVKLSWLRKRTVDHFQELSEYQGIRGSRKLEEIFDSFYKILVEANPNIRPTIAPEGMKISVPNSIKIPGE